MLLMILLLLLLDLTLGNCAPNCNSRLVRLPMLAMVSDLLMVMLLNLLLLVMRWIFVVAPHALHCRVVCWCMYQTVIQSVCLFFVSNNLFFGVVVDVFCGYAKEDRRKW